MEILQLKCTKTEWKKKKSPDRLQRRKVTEFKERIIESTQSKEQKGEKCFKKSRVLKTIVIKTMPSLTFEGRMS